MHRMKTRFTTIDLKSTIAEIIKSNAIGLRVMNVYDIDNKNYLIRLVHGEIKVVILIESGNRIHLTEYDWPKNMMPSSFSMKCRKHLKGRRLSHVKQLGVDRIVDFTFGYDEAAYHLIVELYDRGNIILTDFEYTILQLLRVRADTDKDVKFAVRERYPLEMAKQHEELPNKEKLKEIIQSAKPGDNLKRILNPKFVYGPALLEHCLLKASLQPNSKAFKSDNEEDMDKLMVALKNAQNLFQDIDQNTKGYILQKAEKRPTGESQSDLLTYAEFHPFLFTQHENQPHIEFESFNKSVDEFFSKLESQKIDMKAISQEKAALKRLENVKEDHEKRLEALKSSQDFDTRKAELIELNLPLVERAIATINSAIANQIDWEEIQEIVKEAQEQRDLVACSIKSLKLDSNQIVMLLSDNFEEESSTSEEENYSDGEGAIIKKNYSSNPLEVSIDLALTAFANARSYHNKRRHAASKEAKTIQASKKALKSAEQKTKETLKEVQTAKLINRTRKTNWFEKFFWFISSENYLVVAGRDQQQNEMIVKRYLRTGDLYVHADLHGASSVVIKNPNGGEVPPKTLNEAGTMAICYSAAWDARIVTSAWWVHHHQVSKTAPSGEYLTTGSFMIRGKKNYLPPSHLVMGFSVLFKLDDASIPNHKNDRRVRILDEEEMTKDDVEVEEIDEEIRLDDELDGEDASPNQQLDVNVNKNLIDLKREELAGGDSEVKPAVIDHEDAALNQHKEAVKVSGDEDIKIEEGETKIAKQENEDEDEEEFEYPDTNIELHHVTGDVYQLHRGTSTYSNDDPKETVDGEEPSTSQRFDQNRKPKMSAKQRRDLKKKKNKGVDDENDINQIESSTSSQHQQQKDIPPPKDKSKQNQQSVNQQPQLKRGKKKKLKKIKEKYKDQDEEDRELMQQILRSHEPEKAAKRKGKQREKQSGVTKTQQQQKVKKAALIATDILHDEDASALTENADNLKNEEDDDDERNEEQDKENTNILDSLTGCPVAEDVLLYAVPVCAPYSCMQTYKYKVKITPGSGKRGKAAKTAVHMFLQAKEATDWEKDLFKSLKDVDISRNIPGKVKVSAPNLQRVKKK